jgi:hypothetical protein
MEGVMSDEPLVWERVEWRQGDGRYRFEVERGGLHAKLTAPHGSSLTLPIVAWEGLLDGPGRRSQDQIQAGTRLSAALRRTLV